ncbi:MAG: amidohydrolase family protein [Gordonia amarae]
MTGAGFVVPSPGDRVIVRPPGVIDVHAHAVLPMSMGCAGAAGPEIGYRDDGSPFFRVGEYVLDGVRYEGSAFMDPEVRVAAMDAAGIGLQMISPNPITYFTRLDARSAADYARAHNDAIAETAGRYPGRLVGAAQLPMQDVPAAIAELERSVRELGLVAAYIDTDIGDRTLDAPELDDFYSAAVELDVPVFIHPSPVGQAGPPDDPRLRRFDLDLLLGFSYDETLAVAALVFGGVLERHPALDVCLSHGGGTLAFVAGRFARAVAKPRAWVPELLAENGIEPYLRRLWLDTHVHSAGSLQLLIDTVGTDRLVFGTNFAGWDADGATEVDALGDLRETATANATSLLRL